MQLNQVYEIAKFTLFIKLQILMYIWSSENLKLNKNYVMDEKIRSFCWFVTGVNARLNWIGWNVQFYSGEDGVQLRANWHRLNKVGPKDQELDDGDQPSVNFNG